MGKKKKFKFGGAWLAALGTVVAAGVLLQLAAAATYVRQSGSARSGTVVCGSGQTCSSGGVTAINRTSGTITVTSSQTTSYKSPSGSVSQTSSTSKGDVVKGQVVSVVSGSGEHVSYSNVSVVNMNKQGILDRILGGNKGTQTTVTQTSGGKTSTKISGQAILCVDAKCQKQEGGVSVIYTKPKEDANEEPTVIDGNAEPVDESEGDSTFDDGASLPDDGEDCGPNEICDFGDETVFNDSDDEATVFTDEEGTQIATDEGTQGCTGEQLCDNGEGVVVMSTVPNTGSPEVIEETSQDPALENYVETVKEEKLTCKQPRVFFVFDWTSRSFLWSKQYNFFYDSLCELQF